MKGTRGRSKTFLQSKKQKEFVTTTALTYSSAYTEVMKLPWSTGVAISTNLNAHLNKLLNSTKKKKISFYTFLKTPTFHNVQGLITPPSVQKNQNETEAKISNVINRKNLSTSLNTNQTLPTD